MQYQNYQKDNGNEQNGNLKKEDRVSRDLLHQLSYDFLKSDIEESVKKSENEINIYQYQFPEFRNLKILKK